MQRVFNLVTNARDAMPDGGVVEITTEPVGAVDSDARSAWAGTYVRIRVKDPGRGMPAEVLRRVFDPFFTTKGEKGTGIGLAQVHSFTKMIGGHVSIASERAGGTPSRFRNAVPLRPIFVLGAVLLMEPAASETGFVIGFLLPRASIWRRNSRSAIT